MATLRDVIQGAYAHLALLPLNRELDADRAESGLAAINDMFASWVAQGIGEAPLPRLTLDDSFPFGAQHVQAAKALLAVQLAPASGVDVPTAVEREANRGWNALLAGVTGAPEAKSDLALTHLPSQRRH